MQSPHPDERPLKKRRFFTEDSSPVQVRSKPADLPPSSPPPPPPLQQPQDSEPPPIEGTSNGAQQDFDGFDVETLQAIVGELSISTLQKLKDVSASNVERGMHVLGRY